VAVAGETAVLIFIASILAAPSPGPQALPLTRGAHRIGLDSLDR
jgi:hypothetical protein